MAATLTDTFPRRAPYDEVFARLLEIGKRQGADSKIVGVDAVVFTVSNSFPETLDKIAARHLVIMDDLAAAFPAG